jgi:hypothetical protein
LREAGDAAHRILYRALLSTHLVHPGDDLAREALCFGSLEPLLFLALQDGEAESVILVAGS